jgi:Arc-like DNA binding domain
MARRKLTDVVQVNLRLRESLRRRLEEEAEKRGFSFNAELTRRLEESFEREELNEALRATMRQVLREGGLAEALRPLVDEILKNINFTAGIARGSTAEALREIEARRELETESENKS